MKKTYKLTLREIHKIADAGGRNYYGLLHLVMLQGKFSNQNKDRFKSWAERVLKKKLK